MKKPAPQCSLLKADIFIVSGALVLCTYINIKKKTSYFVEPNLNLIYYALGVDMFDDERLIYSLVVPGRVYISGSKSSLSYCHKPSH